MAVFDYILLALLFVIVVFLFIFLKYAEHPFKFMFTYSASSLIVFAIMNLTAFFSGLYIPVNWYSVITAAVCGIPGLVFLAIAKELI